MNYLAAFLLIIAAVWNIRCEAEKKNIRQAQFQYYLHINSKPYKKSLKQDTLFALRLDSIDKVNKIQSSLQEMNVHKPYMPK
jgi:hypothetical protein